ncbi:MAG: DNA-processing protein DprA, partial [Marinobacter sp.]|nr:DNA-processing protein DprA [Marinobacter sp.]
MFSSLPAQWLFLTCIPKFGHVRRHELLAEIPELTDLLTMNAATLRALGLASESLAAIQAWQQQDQCHPAVAEARGILDNCRHHGIGIVAWQDTRYPEQLRHIHNAPVVLYTLGDTGLLGREQIGIIGSRKATRAGLDHARRFAAELSARDLLVSSGLALGVDG